MDQKRTKNGPKMKESRMIRELDILDFWTVVIYTGTN